MLQVNEKLLVLPDAASAAQTAAVRVSEILFRDSASKAERSSTTPAVASQTAQSITVALSGGKTPAAMYRLLVQPPLREAGDWKTIEWFWSDERCAPPDHAESNYRMAMETLLGPLVVPAERIHRMPADAGDLDAAAEEYENTLRRIARPEPFAPSGEAAFFQPQDLPALDLILLGIGSDGHTASLFPGSAALSEGRRLVIPNYAPGPGAMRMTFTYPLLWSARHILFLACGGDKADAIRRIFTDPRSAAPPAALIRQTRGQITWVLDAAAARLVSSA